MKLCQVLCLSVLSLSTATHVFAEESSVKQGEVVLQAAQQWLALLEEEKYDESREQASQAFQASIDKKAWRAKIARFRNGTGALVSRSLSSMLYDDLANKKKICTLYFFTQYEKRTVPRETLLMIYEDSAWRVAGYFGQ